MNQINLEQEFKMTLYFKKLTHFNKKQINKYLIKIIKQMMIKDNTIKYFVKKSIN
uniref:Uncharacterized protein ycf18 n=1 Tax=Kapraunia schneideri TaxID=717899 RepID=A0A1Z1MSY9_9FLOR|nr:phycobilisome degradation protein [Kapraunia schneideri]ARW68875.1 phycobilisome degradation protein [Kapraunia schneideri]